MKVLDDDCILSCSSPSLSDAYHSSAFISNKAGSRIFGMSIVIGGVAPHLWHTKHVTPFLLPIIHHTHNRTSGISVISKWFLTTFLHFLFQVLTSSSYTSMHAKKFNSPHPVPATSPKSFIWEGLPQEVRQVILRTPEAEPSCSYSRHNLSSQRFICWSPSIQWWVSSLHFHLQGPEGLHHQ